MDADRGHRPLQSGLKLRSGIVAARGRVVETIWGTLTGVGFRPNGTKVLVSNQHVMAGLRVRNNVKSYQRATSQNKIYQGSLIATSNTN